MAYLLKYIIVYKFKAKQFGANYQNYINPHHIIRIVS